MRRIGAAVAGLLIWGLGAVAPPLAQAAGEAERRLTAEVLVMEGDARRLTDPALTPVHRRGLEARLRGALAILPLSARAVRDTNAALPALPAGAVEHLRQSLESNDLAALRAGLRRLGAALPFDPRGLLPPDTRPAATARVKKLHADYCAACHDHPYLDVERPAWSLHEMAGAMPAAEFAARLVIGVKGERLMALENPLTNAEMSALLGLYQGTRTPRP